MIRSLDLARPTWLFFALLGFLVVIYFSYIAKVSHSEHSSRSAFLRWRTQLQDLDDGVNVWDKHAYPNPPIMAMILRPFMQAPPLVGASLWFWCKAFLTIASVCLVLSLLDHPARPFPAWGKLLAIGLTLRPIEGDLVHGNVNLFILFLVMFALFAFCKGRDFLAGMTLGLAIACKVTPGLFIVYFLWKRAWKTLAGTAAGLLMFVLFMPSLVFGWQNNLAYLHSWHRQMVAPYAAGIVSSEHKNQSLPALVHRLLSDTPSFSDYDGDRKITLDAHNLASLDQSSVQAIIIACFLLYLALAARHCRTPLETRWSPALLAEFGIVIVGMLLFCERTWKHHAVILLIPFAVLSYDLATQRRWRVGVLLAIVALLMLSTSSGHVDVEVESNIPVGKWMQVYGAYTWAFLLLLLGLLTSLRQPVLRTPYSVLCTETEEPPCLPKAGPC